MTTPFGVSATNAGNAAFKGVGDYLQNWWDGVIYQNFTEFKVEYEYALSVPLSGFGSIAVEVDKAVDSSNMWTFGKGPVDEKGNDAVDINEDTELVSNGWRKRTVTYSTENVFTQDLVTQKASLKNIYFLMSMKKSDIPASGTIDFYLKSMSFYFHGQWYNIYGSAHDSVAKQETFWAASGSLLHNRFESNEDTDDYKPGQIFSDGAVDTLSHCTGTPKDELKADGSLKFGGTWSEVDLPAFTTIGKTGSCPTSLIQDATYDLKGFVTTTDGSEVTVTVKRGGTDVSVADPTRFVPDEAGEYAITYTATTTDGHVSTITLGFTCAPSVTPVFNENEVTAAIPATGHAHADIEVKKVQAKVGAGEGRLIDSELEIKKGDSESGETVEAKDGGTKWTFTPTRGEDADYYVRFKAVNSEAQENNVGYSEWHKITVTDIDKPVINFEHMFNGEVIGTRYTLEDILSGLTVTDITDGTIEDYTVEIYSPTGAKMTEDKGTYFISNSGDHRVVVTAEDSEGHSVTAEGKFTAAATAGCVLQGTFNVEEEFRAAGTRKKDVIQLFDIQEKNVVLTNGSKIIYDVMAYTIINGEMKFISGVGAISGQFKGNWHMMSEEVIGQSIGPDVSETAVDNNGLGMRATADLSSKLHDGNMKAVWLHREYTVTDGDGLNAKEFAHLSMPIDTTAECGEQIFVYFRNFVVVKPDGTQQSIGTTTDPLGDAWKNDNDGKKLNVASHNISATIDKYPVYIDGEIPATVGLGKTVKLSKHVMKDAYKDEFVSDIKYTVTDPKGAPVELAETDEAFTFTASVRGNYKVTLVGTNDIGSTVKELTIRADDTEIPTVEKGTFSEAKKGEPFTATFICADNVTDPDDLEIEAKVFAGSASVEAEVTYEDGTITVTFTPDKAGDYRIIVTVTDEADQSNTKSFTVTVTDGASGGSGTGESGKKGCGSTVAETGISLAVCLGTVLAAGAFVLVRKVRK